MSDTKNCPYCAEEIRAEAVRCRYCRSRLVGFEGLAVQRWHRGHDDARLAGVSTGLARAFSVPVSLVRLAFIVLTFFHMFGVFVYAALWLVMPPAAREESLLEVLLGRLQTAARKLRGGGEGQDDAATAPPPAPTENRESPVR